MTYPSPAKGDMLYFYYRTVGAARSEIQLYNVAGEKVMTLTGEHSHAGAHRKAWDIRDVAPGIYIYRVMISEQSGKVYSTKSGKVVVVKN